MFFNKKALGIGALGKKVARFRSWRSKNADYRIDYNRNNIKFLGLTVSIFKILYKSSYIALIQYLNGSYSYISSTHGMKIGSIVASFNLFNFNRLNKKLFKPGSIIFLKLLPRYSIFCNLRINNSLKPIYARSAGTYCQLLEKFSDYNLATIKLPTGSNKTISLDSNIIIGRNSNIFNKYSVYGKAGIRRCFGKKPIVRGVAMNPVDHPNGGRTKTNKPEKSLWGWVAKKNC